LGTAVSGPDRTLARCPRRPTGRCRRLVRSRQRRAALASSEADGAI